MSKRFSLSAALLALSLSVLPAMAQTPAAPIGPGAGSAPGSGGSGTMGQVTIGTAGGGASTGQCSSTTSINCVLSTELATARTITSSASVLSTDAGGQVIGNAATAQTLTLTGIVTSQYLRFINKGAGTWTLTAGTGSVNAGCTSVAQNQSADIQFDGTNWNIACGVGGGSSTITAGSTVTASITSGNLIGSTTNTVVDSLVPFANFPVSGTTNGDVAIFSGTTGAFADSNVLLSSLAPLASPTFTGTVNTSAITIGGAITYGGVTLSNSVTGTGSMVLSASPTFTGTALAAAITASGVVTSNSANTGFSHSGSSSGLINDGFRNTNAGSAAQLEISIGNNTSANEVTMILNGGAFTGANNQFTINSTGNMFLSGGATQAIEVSSAGAVSLLNQGTSGTIADAVCVTSAGLIVLDSSVTVCGLSPKWAKDQLGIISAAQASAALDKLPQGVPFWNYKKDIRPGDHERVGLYADDVEAMDKRCVEYDSKTHRVKNYDDRCLIGYLIADRQTTKAEIEDLKGRVH